MRKGELPVNDTETTDYLREQIEPHLQAIQRIFIPGSKITLLVRNKIPDADMVMTNDDLSVAAARLIKEAEKDRAQ